MSAAEIHLETDPTTVCFLMPISLFRPEDLPALCLRRYA
jgi:hypothetical protein